MMDYLTKWFTFGSRKSKDVQKAEDGVGEEKGEEAKEGGGSGGSGGGDKPAEEKENLPVFSHLKQRQSMGSMDTIVAVQDAHTRRMIVTRRIKRLKCWILVLAAVAFTLSVPFFYILYSTYPSLTEGRHTIGLGLVDRHVRGTALLEVIVSIELFVVCVFRVIFPKNEALYYFAQISYLFAVCQYGILVPLNIRNSQKNLSHLKELMWKEGDTGRCVKVEVDTVVPSGKQTYQSVVDSHGCTLHQKKMNLPHIRPVLKITCDGPDSWYQKAVAYSNVSKRQVKDPTDTWYEVNSELWTATQKTFKCCGIDGFMDWTRPAMEADVGENRWMIRNHHSSATELAHFVFPRSCCPPEIPVCFGNETYGPNCYPFAVITIMAHSVGQLLTLVACAVANTFTFVFLIRLRRMVEKFRPDLLEM